MAETGTAPPASPDTKPEDRATALRSRREDVRKRLSQERRGRRWVLAVAGATAILTGYGFYHEWAAWVVTTAGFFATVLLLGGVGAQVEVSNLAALAEQLEERLETEELPKGSNYFDSLVHTNVTNLRDYYYLVKIQTQQSFYAAVGTGLVGFLLVAVGLATAFRAEDTKAVIGYVSAGSGVVTEFISAVFFYLYNRTVRQLKEYHDSLLDVQSVLFSLKLVGDAAVAEKPQMIQSMLRFLMDRDARDRRTAAGRRPGGEASRSAAPDSPGG
ncbi:MAG TPA: hypothetical protein VH092_21790 [Urbifossiella sp.]|jgi:hypothetical protein|nr:hypothetical protein [Urbifossiella sp.]